jgi:hypothetical protein
MRICVIGNSHVAMIKIAWDAIQSDYSDVEITFFAAKVPMLRAIRRRGDKLIFSRDVLRQAMLLTSNGIDHIAADYDAYLIVGAEISLRTLVNPAEKLGPQRMDTLDAVAELESTLAVTIIRHLRKITTAPIAVLPAPYHTGANAAFAYEWKHGDGTMTLLNDAYVAALDTLSRKLNFEFHPQPRETLQPTEFLTQDKFSHGAMRYDVQGKSGQGDGRHMNMEFGALYLRSVLSTLGAAPTSPSKNP